ncbi:hypothetical protein SUGI_1044690 [Cryptomeria japonica]|nr:hypothetical protein SUGI_1044690 [Cryptomeria japonica]
MITSTHETQNQNERKKVSRQVTTPLSIPMETQLESGGEEWSTLHQALTWAERYKIALEMATTLIHAQAAPRKSSDHILMQGSSEAELWKTTNWRSCVESFGKLLYALISAKELSGAAKVASSMVGDGRTFRAALWLRRHMIPPLPWACPLRRYYILNGEDLDERMRDEIMASGRAIVQLGAALRVVIRCTQDDPPTMAEVYRTLEAANCCEIPWSLTTALAIGFPLYRTLALLVYLVVFLYVGIYKSLGMLVFYFPYALGVYDSPGYDPFDALLLLFSLLALMWLVLKTVCSFNRLDDVLYLDE